jgi:superfamily II DNA or RNA helicase
MSIKELYPDQTDFAYNISVRFASGIRKLIGQLPTGGGKTVIFASIAARYIKKNPNKRVVIHVDRKELAKQIRTTIYEMSGITAQPIVAGMKSIPVAQIYIAMVETVNNKLKKQLSIEHVIPNVGLCIIDEAHEGRFNKIHKYFDNALILGFTATPISASKKNPLNKNYEDIVCGKDIPELIELSRLCQNRTYAIKDNVSRQEFGVVGDDFNEGQMAVVFSKKKQIENTVKGYEKFALGKKTIIYNCNIAHSLLVTKAFLEKGYKVMHLDSEKSYIEGMDKDTYREYVLNWHRTTPGAILCNVGILTKGYDDPTVECIIMNRSTMSLSLWLQCTGRGGRVYPLKEYFVIIDLGGNAITHGDWSDARNWYDIFHNPPKASKREGVAPVKDCPQCDAIIPARATACPYCNYEFPPGEMKIDTMPVDFVLITKKFNVKQLLDDKPHIPEYTILKAIGSGMVKELRLALEGDIISDEVAEHVLKQYHEKTKEWCKQKSKRFNEFHRTLTKEHLYTQLKEAFPLWEHQVQQ